VLRTVRRTKTGPRRDVITVVDQPLLGTGAPPIVPAAVAGRADRARDGRARIGEVKLACLFTSNLLRYLVRKW
jgi:hypothetical protein